MLMMMPDPSKQVHSTAASAHCGGSVPISRAPRAAMTVDMHLSAIVTACAVPATLLAYASRGHAPWPVVAALGYTAGVGYIFALASSDLGAQRSTGLLGKVRRRRLCASSGPLLRSNAIFW